MLTFLIILGITNIYILQHGRGKTSFNHVRLLNFDDTDWFNDLHLALVDFISNYGDTGFVNKTETIS